ncbi:hypothetical protein ACFXI6_29870, partial [Streptomyces mirabilis]|uniref:hypothetical protein n=1 Tax=Streptomyces mirabilis TaxID=68239 RepID=UPI0036B2AC9C
GTLWTDRISVTDPAVEVLAHYRGGTYADRPAVPAQDGFWEPSQAPHWPPGQPWSPPRRRARRPRRQRPRP